jgi:acetylornithine deacetylase
VPDECVVTLDIRTVPGQDNQKTLADLEAYVRERVPERDGLQVVFDPPGHDSPSFETAGDHPLVQTACALRGQAVAEVVPYGCDASKLAAAGIPSIIFGPGDIAQAHTKDEFIALTDLEAGTAAYTDLTLKLLH